MKNEKKFNKKALKKGSFALVISAVALAIVIVLNILVAQLPESVLHPDTTKTGLMSIGSETKDILSRLDTDIVITHYVDGSKTGTTETSNTNYISGILQRYAEASSHITVKTVDIVETNVQDETVSQNMITVKSLNDDGSERRSKTVTADEIFMCEISGYEGQYMSLSEYNQMAQYYSYYGQTLPAATNYFFAENAVTGAIDYVMQETLPVVYELSGHGETSLGEDEGFGKLCKDENVELKDLALQGGESVAVPEDARAVLINAPQTDISADEAEALKTYVKGGGNVILTTYVETYGEEKTPNLAGFCKFMGLRAIEEQILEDEDSHYYNYVNWILAGITGNGITSALDNTNYYFYMVMSHAITTADTEGAESSVETYSLLETSDKAFVYKDENGDGQPDTDDVVRSKYSLAYQSVLKDDTGASKGELIWFASPAVFDANYASGTGNSYLFNAILTKTCEKNDRISLIGKEMSQSYLTVTPVQQRTFITVCCIAIPLCTILVGIAVWASRRRK